MNTKRMMVIAAAIGIMVFVTGVSYAGDWSRPDRRQDKQSDRIRHGVRNGEITGGELHRLKKEQALIDREIEKAWADGWLAPWERNRIEQLQDRANRQIERSKHNNRAQYGYKAPNRPHYRQYYYTPRYKYYRYDPDYGYHRGW